MQQHELRPPRGAKKERKRVGRGNSSGSGTYSGRGLKGQQARSGYKTRPQFEGGQTPLVRRLPHRRGFRNPFRVEYTPVNLKQLASMEGSDVTPESLRDAGITNSLRKPIKILGDGDLTAALTVKVHRVSAAARAKIEAAGGTVEELTPRKEMDEKRERRKARAKNAPKAQAPSTDSTGEGGDTSSSDSAPSDDSAPSEDGGDEGDDGE